jgi:hypothetical protein
MLGRNPLFVAQQHGHSVLTMLSVYAAWTRGTPEADVVSIRRGMHAPAYAMRKDEVTRAAPVTPDADDAGEARGGTTDGTSPAAADWAIDRAIASRESGEMLVITSTWIGGADGNR